MAEVIKTRLLQALTLLFSFGVVSLAFVFGALQPVEEPDSSGSLSNNKAGNEKHDSIKKSDANPTPTYLYLPQHHSSSNQVYAESTFFNESELVGEVNQYVPKSYEKIYKALYVPNDYLASGWHLPKIQADSMWDYSIGNEATLIAIIDTGFGLDHEDLWQRWYINDGEQGMTDSDDLCWSGSPVNKQSNNCDDDNNSYIDDWRGWDFINNDNNPNAGTTSPAADAVYHGTAVAGLAAGTGNNDVGVVGMNWQARVLPLQALGDNGVGSTNTVRGAINYAVAIGADVINLSLGSDEPDALMEDAILNALNNDVVVVAAAGNDGCECMVYPANYPQTLSVGASTSTDTRAGFSSYGNNLDVVAPGELGIQTLRWKSSNQNHDYTSVISGTSIATPIVSGLVSVIRGLDPSLSAGEVMAAISGSADKVAAMSGQDFAPPYGYGRINALTAMQNLGFAQSIDPPVSKWPIYYVYKASTGNSFYTANRDRVMDALKSGYTYSISKLSIKG